MNDPYINNPNAPYMNSREALRPKVNPRVQKLDPIVSKIVGKPIASNDPRLIREVIKWKQANQDENNFDNHLKDPKKREELKKIFA